MPQCRRQYRMLGISALIIIGVSAWLSQLEAQSSKGDAVTEKFLPNVVQVQATFSDGAAQTGFGFVVGERDNILYVVTARHVVRSTTPDVTTQAVTAIFYDDAGRARPAEPLNVRLPETDLALLALPRPFAQYAWQARFCDLQPQRGQEAWFIGRNGKWDVPLRPGLIEKAPRSISGGKFLVNLASVEPGTSGAPLITERGIAGMIIEDTYRDQTTVLGMQAIYEAVAAEWNYPWGLQEYTADAEPSATPQVTATATPSAQPTPAPTPQPTEQPTATPSPQPTATPSVKVTVTPSPQPTLTPTAQPTAWPSPQPTATPQSKATPMPEAIAAACWENETAGAICIEPTTGMEFVYVPGGEFWMGCGERESHCHDDEKPRHAVRVDGFWMGKYEVTQAQWETVMEKNPAFFNPKRVGAETSQHPVEQVSWNDAQMFVTRLNAVSVPQDGMALKALAPLRRAKVQYIFRLPSEAEWEYACRAGTTTPFSFGATIKTEQANYDGNYTYANGKSGPYRKQTTAAGSLPPNNFGLYEMHGNVWEWVADTYHGNYTGAPTDGSVWGNAADKKTKIMRGGSWNNQPFNVRSADRNQNEPDSRSRDLGVRVVAARVKTP